MSQQQYRNERARVLRKLIGKNCKTLREYRGLTIKQVAEGTKISLYRLKKLETGQLDVTPSLLIAICDYFEILVDCMAYQDLSIEQ
jgi:transcriptional regulator with XRE-family HTH domain